MAITTASRPALPRNRRRRRFGVWPGARGPAYDFCKRKKGKLAANGEF